MIDFTGFPQLPSFSPQPSDYAPAPVPNDGSNPIWAGLKAGGAQAAGALASSVAAVNKVAGADQGAANAQSWSDYLNSKAQQMGRPDLDQQGWFNNGVGGLVSKGSYEIAKTLPTLAGVIGAGALVPEAAIPSALARVGATAPAFFGGGAGLEGAAGLAAGRQLAGGVLAGTGVLGAESAGSLYDTASKQPGGATRGDAAKALAMGVPLGALQSIVPAGGAGMLTRGSAGTILQRVTGAGLANAAAGAIGGGAQAAADVSFQPNLTPADKANAVLSATLQSAALGGLLGSVFGLHGEGTSNDALSKQIDGVVGPSAEGAAQPAGDPLYGNITARSPQPTDNSPSGYHGPRPGETIATRPIADSVIPSARPADTLDRLDGVQPFAQTQGGPLVPYEGGRGTTPGGIPFAEPAGGALVPGYKPTIEEGFAQPVGGDLVPAPGGGPVMPEGMIRNVPSDPGVQPPTAGERLAHAADIDIRAPGEVQDFLKGMQAQTGPEAYNEILAASDTALGKNEDFKRISNSFGIGRDIDAELTDFQKTHPQADAGGAGATEFARLQRLAALRDQAEALREPPAQGGERPQLPAPVDNTPAPPAAPVQTFTELAAKDAKVSGARGSMRDFINSSQATSPEELHNELLAAIDRQDPVTDTKSFDKLAQTVGVGRDLDAEMADMRKKFGVQRDDQIRDLGGPLYNDAMEIKDLQGVRDRAAALRDQTAAAAPETSGGTPAEVPADTAPQSNAERVVAAAREITGDAGGEVPIHALREALPDVAKPDLDSALKQIHGDDTANELTKAPQGQRSGLDGVTVGDAGKFHALSVEPLAPGERLAPDTPAQPTKQVNVESPPAQEAASVGATPDEIFSNPDPEARSAVLSRMFAGPEGDNVAGPGHPTTPTGETESEILPKRASDVAGEYKTVMDSTTAARHFADLTSKIRPDVAAKVHLVANMGDMPPDFLQRAAKQGLNVNELAGVYDRGEVYVNASLQPTREHMEDTISHEVFGHFATDKRFGDAYAQGIADIWNRAGGYDGIKAIAQKFGVWDDMPNGGTGVKAYLPIGGFRMTPRDMTVAVEELIAHAAESRFVGKAKLAFMAIAAKFKNGIADVLEGAGLKQFAKTFRTFTANDLAHWLAETRQALNAETLTTEQRSSNTGTGEPAVYASARKVANQNETTGRLESLSASVMQRIHDAPVQEAERRGMQMLDGLRSLTGMARAWATELPGLTQALHRKQDAQAIAARINQVHVGVNQRLGDFQAQFPNAAKSLMKIMQMGTEHKLDVLKTWADHTHLHDDPRAPELAKALEGMKVEWNKLGQNYDKAPAGLGQQLYRDANSISRGDNFARMAQNLDNVVKQFYGSQGIAGFESNPGRDLMSRNDIHDNPQASEAYWQQHLQQRMDGVQKYLNQQDGQVALGQQAGDVAPLREVMARYGGALNAQAQSPYFHLGRFGDYFVSMHMKQAVDAEGKQLGRPDPAALAKIQQAMEASGHGDVSMNTLSNQAHVFMRVKNLDDMTALQNLAHKFKASDLLDPEEQVRAGAVTSGEGVQDLGHTLLNRMVDAAQAHEAYDESYGSPDQVKDLNKSHDQMVQNIRAMALDVLPDNSLQRVLQPRVGTQGYDSNMFRNFAHRGEVQAHAIAGMATRPELNQIAMDLRAQARAATAGTNGRAAVMMQDRVNEYLRRDMAGTGRVPSSFLTGAASFFHTFYVGASPGYMLMNVSQIPTLLWPELSKKFGAVRSAQAIGTAASDAFKVMRAIASSGHFTDAGVTPEILDKAGLAQSKKDLLMNLVNRGDIELGSFTRATSNLSQDRGQIASTAEKGFHMANATALQSEVFSRLVSALSAHNLDAASPGKLGATHINDYTHNLLGETMFNWGSYDTPRGFGRAGYFGEYSPLITKFHQFTTKITEKLVHETTQALGGDAEAQKFMGAHLAAVIALSGTMGLPAAGWFAGAATKLSGLANGGEGYDVEAHYRNFLASVFGKDVGEMIARGLPRTLGVDTSDLGDGELAPMTKLIEDRRKFEDASQSYLAHAWGAPVSTIPNLVLGMRDMMNGRPMEGLARTLPVSMRNMVKAFQMTEHGYVDSQGRSMPIDANAGEIIKQALGLESGAHAEYEDKANVLEGRKNDAEFKAGTIKQNLAIALERNDEAGTQKWMSAMRDYDADPAHLGQPIGSTISQFLANRARAVAYSKSTGAPLGTNPRDLPGLQLTQY